MINSLRKLLIDFLCMLVDNMLTKSLTDILERYGITLKTANDSVIIIQVKSSNNFKIIENKYVTFLSFSESLETISQIGLEINV